MRLRTLIAVISFSFASTLYADSVFRIEAGPSYDQYSNRDLRRRVWELERAVAQLQQKVFELQVNGTPVPKNWTCYMQALSETFTDTAATESAAKASVIQNCSRRYGAIHCKDTDVKCGN